MSLKTTNTEYKVNIILKTVILFVVIVIVNLFFSDKIYRFDLTEDKLFTITDVTKNMLNDIDDYVNIEVYFSERLPQQLMPVRQEVEDILKEYVAYSNNFVRVKFVDPTENPDIRERVIRTGVPEVQMNIFEKDERKVINGFLGLAIFYGDNTSVIPVIQDTRNLEYDLTSGIRRVTIRDIPTIGFFTDKNSLNIRDGNLEDLAEEITKHFSVQEISLDHGKNQIPENLDLLIIPGPKEKFTEREKFEIDQYIMSGGKVIFLLDGVKVEPNLTGRPLDLNLTDMLANYGILFNNNLVLDKINEHAAFRSGHMQFVQPYPYFVKPVSQPGWSGFNKDNPATSRLDSMIFQWVSSIDTYPHTTSRANYHKLIKSSPQSWESRVDMYHLHPQNIQQPRSFNSYTLALLAEGQFNSFFADKEIPKIETSLLLDSEDEEEIFFDSRLGDEIIPFSDTTHILVVGNSDFIIDGITRQNPNNLTFILNMIDWLALDDNLIDIRARGTVFREIKDLESSQRNMIRFLNIYTIPIIVIVFGIIRYLIKKRRRFIKLAN